MRIFQSIALLAALTLGALAFKTDVQADSLSCCKPGMTCCKPGAKCCAH